MSQLIRFIALAVAHKIGEIVNPTSLYSEKYRKECQNFMMLARNVSLRENWNVYDKETIKKDAFIKTIAELNTRRHIEIKDFSTINQEIDNALKDLNLFS